MARVAVLGIGNILMGDDAVGPYVLKLLEARYDFPAEAVLIEAGTPGLDLLPLLEGIDTLVVVDALRANGAPGEIRVLDRAELLDHPPVQAMNLHEPGLREALLTLELTGSGPREVRLIGVVPEQTETGVGLSPVVRQAIPLVLSRVVAQLAEFGVTARERSAANAPDLWWE